ncbi:hypothetical protein GCM10022417_20720 [Corynebacterium pilbarense]
MSITTIQLVMTNSAGFIQRSLRANLRGGGGPLSRHFAAESVKLLLKAQVDTNGCRNLSGIRRPRIDSPANEQIPLGNFPPWAK